MARSSFRNPPRDLEVQTTLDGFRCQVRPRRKLGSNSAWIIVFVAMWWSVALIAVIGLTALVPDLLDRDIGTMPVWAWILGPIGLLGWGPAWSFYDAKRSAVTQEIEVTATKLRIGDEGYLLTDLVGVDRRGKELFVQREGGGTVAVGARGLSYKERDWVQERLAEVIAQRAEPDQPTPSELASLMGKAET
ncbi:MAG: hypothetical protein KC912_21975 [Proteobacteria bacterium]|nr:hypothetical protein [Pseudomonadota bacterium]